MLRASRSLSIKLTLLFTVLALISYFIYYQFKGRPVGLDKSIIEMPVAATLVVAANAPNSANNTSPAPMNTGAQSTTLNTYRPGVLRGHRIINANMNEMMDGRKKISYWLYAQSEKDAQWLDQYGYPTPEEHDRLLKATDAEIDSLVKYGDMNAKVHQAVRTGLKAISSGKPDGATGAIDIVLNEGGPYQAVTVVRGFRDMLDAFEKLPPDAQTDELRKMMQYLDGVKSRAVAMGMAYGDQSGRYSINDLYIDAKSKRLGLNSPYPSSAENGISLIVTQARYRENYGLPPLTITPRPFDPVENEKVVIERY